jgi:phospholipase/carboxylesterase
MATSYTRADSGQLTARPTTRPKEGITPGLHRPSIGRDRDALLYVPAGYDPARPAPFALMLHGAGGSAEHGMSLLQPFADEKGLLLLAPDSRDRTWDVIVRNGYGPDIAFIDAALESAFARCAVDAGRVAVGGFSDGASYALSLGLMNGGALFTHVLAFAPGFMAPLRQEGSPRIFISHGTLDVVLPIARCSRRIVPQLKDAGYDVIYREFVGQHTVPAEIARDGVAWFLGAAG